MTGPLIENETGLPTRQVNAIVRWVFRYLDLDGRRAIVKVKHHGGKHAYQGRFYSNALAASGVVWDSTGLARRVKPNVPRDRPHLIVARLAKPELYPLRTHVYKRRGGVEPWPVDDWQEALVSIVAHEAMHLRQHLHGKPFREDETDWAAKRLLDEWKREHGREVNEDGE